MKKNTKIIIGIVITILVGIIITLSILLINQSLKNKQENEPMKENIPNIDETTNEVLLNEETIEKISTFVHDNGKFLQRVFPFWATHDEIGKTHFETEDEKVKYLINLLFSGEGFNTIKPSKAERILDNNTGEEKISLQFINKLAKEYFNTTIDTNKLETLKIENGFITEINSNFGYGITIPAFWKLKYDKESKIYSLYIVDFYSSETILKDAESEKLVKNKYINQMNKAEQSDIEKYSPLVTIINYQKVNNKNIVVSSELTTI